MRTTPESRQSAATFPRSCRMSVLLKIDIFRERPALHQEPQAMERVLLRPEAPASERADAPIQPKHTENRPTPHTTTLLVNCLSYVVIA